jgi:hypothetical protein
MEDVELALFLKLYVVLVHVLIEYQPHKFLRMTL